MSHAEASPSRAAAESAAAAPDALVDIADRIEAAARDGERLTVACIVEAIGERSHAALLLAVSAAAATPLSGVPGLTAISGALIALISAQRLFLGGPLRVPGFLGRRSVPAGRAREAARALRPALAWLDGATKRRLGALFRPPALQIALGLCLVSGLVMPFLELIPFTGSVIASAVALIAVALATRDGLFALFAAIPWLGLGLLLRGIL